MRPPGRRFQDHIFVWDKKFAIRQDHAHRHENNRLTLDYGDTIVEACLDEFCSRLDPPHYRYAAVSGFLAKTNEEELKKTSFSKHTSLQNILLDDRRDDTGWEDTANVRHFARDWNSYAGGYPPEGKDIQYVLMNAGELYTKRLKSVVAVRPVSQTSC